MPEDIELLMNQADWTEEERIRLEKWMAESDENRRAFKEGRRIQSMVKYSGYWNDFDEGRIWMKVENEVQHRKARKLIRRLAGIAALIAMMLGAGWLGWLHVGKIVGGLSETGMVIRPGYSKALLVLSSGKEIPLGTPATTIMAEEGVIIQRDSAGVTYREKGDTPESEGKYNELIVPVGGEYKLCLSDGTVVYLNSLTKLKYPVRFRKDSREVILEGEAYFDVAREDDRPFIVHTEKFGVKVLGTGFNIMAYPLDDQFEVTLVNGKVNVEVGRQTTTLRPSDQIVVDRRTLATEVRQVNVGTYIGWKDGCLNFNAISFEQLTMKLSRWYNVNFFFTVPELRQLKFSGAFRKYDDINYILSLIERTTNVRFKVGKDAITVYRKEEISKHKY